MRSLDDLNPELQKLIANLSTEPGVYLLKDRTGTIIYVGKAKHLRHRVRSYFIKSSDTRAFVASLATMLGDVETIVTHNEKEALLLENTLIKRHKPRFNVMLRDDKNYLVLRLDPRVPYPRLEVMRSIGTDGARYFGPYHSASSCRETLRVVNRFFQLRTCTDQTMASRRRPCLQYQIGRCPAPCVFDVDSAHYARQVEDVTLFLNGRQHDLLDQLQTRMMEASAALNFEYAAQLRDQQFAIRKSLEGQRVVGDRETDRDVFACYREGDAVEFAILKIRRGKLVERRSYFFSGQEFPDEELLSSFVGSYYDRGETIPQEIVLPFEIEDAKSKALWLEELSAHRVTIAVPKRGEKRKLIELAHRNAQSSFVSRREKHRDAETMLVKLQQRLKLRQRPSRIECFDISGFQQQHIVASMVAMEEGVLQPAHYRRFKIRAAQADDFTAIHEAMLRRIRRARTEPERWSFPNLIVIDGGKGQLAAAQAAFKDAGTFEGEVLPELIALAKERFDERDFDEAEKHKPERVFLPHAKDPLRLNPHTAEFFLLTRLRDEAHRFAISHYKKSRRKTTFHSRLEQIPGIGEQRRKALLKQLGSVKQIENATVEELTSVPGMNRRAAERVVEYFGRKPTKET